MKEHKNTPMERPTIPPIPTPVPTRNDPENFAARADATLAAWPANTEGMNLMGIYVEQQGDLATAAAVAAQQSASDSSASAGASEDSRQAAERAAAAAAAAPATPSTSTSELTIQPGDHGVGIETGRLWAEGQFIHVARTSDPGNVGMHGVILAYDSSSGTLSFRVQQGWTQGSGTYSDWTITGSGPPATLELLGVPPAAVRANRLLAFDGDGNPTATAAASLSVDYADRTRHADNAARADVADNATRANTAGRADSAGYADNAGAAGYADNAGAVQGVALIELVRRTSAHLMGMGWNGSRIILSVDNNSFGGTMPMDVTYAADAGRAGSTGYADNAGALAGQGQGWYINNGGSSVINIRNGIGQFVSNVGGVEVFWGVAVSDRTLKYDIAPTEEASDEKIDRMDFHQFHMLLKYPGTDVDLSDGHLHKLGVITQELMLIDEEWVNTAGTYQSLNLGPMLYSTMHAVKLHGRKATADRARIDELEIKVAALAERLNALEAQ